LPSLVLQVDDFDVLGQLAAKGKRLQEENKQLKQRVAALEEENKKLKEAGDVEELKRVLELYKSSYEQAVAVRAQSEMHMSAVHKYLQEELSKKS
jgi:cell division protein FtsB